MISPVSGAYIDDSKEVIGEIKGNPCNVEKKINELFLMIKADYKELRNEDFPMVNRFYCAKWICDRANERLLRIVTLALVLHPEYDYAQIDHWSLNKFLDGYLTIKPKIKYYIRGKYISFREFNPTNKEGL